MAISPFQIKSELEDDIILRETERPCVPSRSVTASRPSQSTNNTRNFVFPTTSVKDEPISFVNYSPVEEDNCEQYDSRNSTGNYNQSLETPALLQRWSEENLNVDPTGDTSFLISSNSTSVSQQPLGGMRSSNSQSRLSEGASTTRESQSSTGINTTSLLKQGDKEKDKMNMKRPDPEYRRKENERRREAYAALKAEKFQTSNAKGINAEKELKKTEILTQSIDAKRKKNTCASDAQSGSQSIDIKLETPKTGQKTNEQQRIAKAKRMKDKRSNPEFRERENQRQREAYAAKIAQKAPKDVKKRKNATKKGKSAKKIEQKRIKEVQHRKERPKNALERDNLSRKKRREDPAYREMELARDNYNRRVRRKDSEYKECEKMRDNMSRKLRRQDPDYVQLERLKDNCSRKYRRQIHENDDSADYEVTEIPNDLGREDNIDSRPDNEVAGRSQTL